MVLLGACIDFVDPDIPHAGTPATLQVWLVLQNEQTAQTQAEFSPGFDDVGLARPVPDETLRIFGQELEPVEEDEDGVRLYMATRDITAADALGPMEIVPPPVTGTTTPDPVHWVGLNRVGPDTIHVAPDADVALELLVAEGGTAPIRQWFLEMRGAGGAIRLSADGVPPERLVVPSLWVPEPAADGAVTVSLSYVQSATRASPTGDYVIAVSLQIRLLWTVVVVEDGTAERALAL